MNGIDMFSKPVIRYENYAYKRYKNDDENGWNISLTSKGSAVIVLQLLASWNFIKFTSSHFI